MPPKRKASTSAGRKSSKNAKSDAESSSSSAASVRPSSYENRPPPEQTIADGWPTGPTGIRRVMKGYQFYSLLRQNRKPAWIQAIQLVRNSIDVGEPIDLSLLPSAEPFRLWLTGGRYMNRRNYWLDRQDDEQTTAQIVFNMFDILRKITAFPLAADQSLPDLLSSEIDGLSDDAYAQFKFGHVVSICTEMQRLGQYPNIGSLVAATNQTTCCLPSTIVGADPDGLVCQMIRLIPNAAVDELLNSGNRFLTIACRDGRENIVRALLEHLPTFDMEIEPIGIKLTTDIADLLTAGRAIMTVYRRDRRLLLRDRLADRLPFDVLELIDAYGAAPPVLLQPPLTKSELTSSSSEASDDEPLDERIDQDILLQSISQPAARRFFRSVSSTAGLRLADGATEPIRRLAGRFTAAAVEPS